MREICGFESVALLFLQEIVEWYCSIRAARLKLLSQKNPGLRINDIISRLSKDFIKYGWVQKTPPPHKANKKVSNMFQLASSCD